MLFWAPDALPCLYPYPDTHLLRRRSRLNMHLPLATQLERFPLAARAAAVEAVLEPGDVVFFPSRCGDRHLPLLRLGSEPEVSRCLSTVQSQCRLHLLLHLPACLRLCCRWAHYTESLDASMSVTWRFGAAR